MANTKLQGEALKKQYQKLGNDWRLIDNHHIEKQFQFKTYWDGVEFVNRLAKLAESQDHHPDIFLGYNQVRVTLCTHSVNGLTEKDFAFATQVTVDF